MGEKNTILLKIASHLEEDARRALALSQLFVSLAAVKPEEKKTEYQSPTKRAEAKQAEGFKCKHGLEAKRIDGVAKTGKNAGKPYIMYVCPKERKDACEYREFEDVQALAAESHVQPDLQDDDIPF